MKLISRLREELCNHGFMPTNVKINGSLNAVTIESPFAQSLYNQLRNNGVNVTFYKFEDMIAVHDTPDKVFRFLGGLKT